MIRCSNVPPVLSFTKRTCWYAALRLPLNGTMVVCVSNDNHVVSDVARDDLTARIITVSIELAASA
mgnify:CR=1 FL=1